MNPDKKKPRSGVLHLLMGSQAQPLDLVPKPHGANLTSAAGSTRRWSGSCQYSGRRGRAAKEDGAPPMGEIAELIPPPGSSHPLPSLPWASSPMLGSGSSDRPREDEARRRSMNPSHLGVSITL